MYAALLQRGKLVFDATDNVLEIVLPESQGFYADTFKSSENIEKLKSVFAKFISQSFGLIVKADRNENEKPSVIDILKDYGGTNIVQE